MSTTSAARVEANRKNAQRSTGPKSPEGKAISRANATKHGLTGNGIVLLAAEAEQVAEVKEHLFARHKPTSFEGKALLERAALQHVRLKRAGKHEMALIAFRVDEAVYDFDQARRDHADDLFDRLDDGPMPMGELLTFPEGIDRLVEELAELADLGEWSGDDLDRLSRLAWALHVEPEVLRGELELKVRMLEGFKQTLDARPIELARARAADLALFDSSPEANLARKYEAATERSLEKCMKAFHKAEGTKPAEPLGSFSPEASDPEPEAPAPRRENPAEPPPADANPPVDRASRPDPRKLREARRRNRR